jgi:FtsH-binding integral membrane protein
MESNNPNYVYNSVVQLDDEATSSRKYLAKVFAWMFVALGISAFCALEFYLTPSLLALIVDPVTHGFTGLGYVALFAPVVFSFVANFGYNRVSYPVMLVLFIAYAACIGVSFSVLGLIYTGASIFSMFLTSALLFGIMSIAGYTTNTDLTKMGSILIMIFMGAFVASLVNFFIGSSELQYILSFVFVAVLIGLTAYYIQMLKRIGAGIEFGSDSGKKLVIIGAYVLYTTFINLFLSMLRLFGRRR